MSAAAPNIDGASWFGGQMYRPASIPTRSSHGFRWDRQPSRLDLDDWRGGRGRNTDWLASVDSRDLRPHAVQRWNNAVRAPRETKIEGIVHRSVMSHYAKETARIC